MWWHVSFILHWENIPKEIKWTLGDGFKWTWTLFFSHNILQMFMLWWPRCRRCVVDLVCQKVLVVTETGWLSSALSPGSPGPGLGATAVASPTMGKLSILLLRSDVGMWLGWDCSTLEVLVLIGPTVFILQRNSGVNWVSVPCFSNSHTTCWVCISSNSSSPFLSYRVEKSCGELRWGTPSPALGPHAQRVLRFPNF